MIFRERSDIAVCRTQEISAKSSGRGNRRDRLFFDRFDIGVLRQLFDQKTDADARIFQLLTGLIEFVTRSVKLVLSVGKLLLQLLVFLVQVVSTLNQLGMMEVKCVSCSCIF